MVVKLDSAARYVPAWFDEGPFHTAPLGFGMHMAEGGGTVGYLDDQGRPPERGVSVHFVAEYSGDIVQMLPVSHACGGLNPADRSTDKGYYGPGILKAVLGGFWTDPNAASIQIEIEGFAAQGPNQRQVDGIIALVAELRAKVPSLRGAFGHADQTDTKKCPGTTLAMRGLFQSIGGHGLWGTDPVAMPIVDTTPVLINAPVGPRYDVDGTTVVAAAGTPLVDAYSPYRVTNGMHAFYSNVPPANTKRIMLARATTKPIPTPPPVDETAVFNQGVDAAVQAAGTARK